MASDEIKKKAINFIESEGMTESFCSACGEPWYSEFVRLFAAGYTQGRADASPQAEVMMSIDELKEYGKTEYDRGRADAWRWRKYPEEKPTLGDTVITYSEYEHNAEVAWLDECDGFGESWVNSHGEVSQVSHWLPITLLTEAK